MLSAKANAALTRLREIEKKYKIKRREQTWNLKEDADSSISSISLDSPRDLTGLKKPAEKVPKPKLDIKIPSARFEECAKSAKSPLREDDEEESGKTSPKLLAAAVDDADGGVATTSLIDRSLRSERQRESPGSVSEVTTIEEDSSIKSVIDDSTTSSRPRSETSQRQNLRVFPVTNNGFLGYDKKTTAGRKPERTKKSEKSSKAPKGKPSPDNSSIGKRSRLFEKSNEEVFKPHFNSKKEEQKKREKEAEEKEQEIVKIPRVASAGGSSSLAGSLRDDNVVDESIGTMESGSEIISVLSRAEESVADKTEDDSARTSNNFIRACPVNSTNISSSLELPVAEDGYANDTFEDVSNSTMRSKSVSQDMGTIDGERKLDPAESSTRKSETMSLEKSHQNDIDACSRNEISPQREAMRNANDCQVGPDEGTTCYIENLDGIDVNPDNEVPSASKSVDSRMGKRRKRYERQAERTFRGNVSTEASNNKTVSSSSAAISDLAKESSTDDMTKTDDSVSQKKSSPEIGMTSVAADQQERQEHRKMVDGRREERAMTGVTRLLVAGDYERIETAESEKERENEVVFKESSDKRIMPDAENVASVLKRLHRHAINAAARRYANSRIAEESCSFSGSKREPAAWNDTIMTRRTVKIENENHCSSQENKMLDCNSHKHSTKRKKRTIKVAKSIEARSCAGSRKEDKTSKYDRKQSHVLQKRIVELQLRQEREDLQKYLHELKDSRPRSGSTRSYFSPLEFPRIAEFTQSDALDLESGSQSVVLQARVSAIRRRLKDQYILYRDYCAMARAINAHYVPTTVEDTKKTIRELRKTTTEIR